MRLGLYLDYSTQIPLQCLLSLFGEVDEWLKSHAWKACIRE